MPVKAHIRRGFRPKRSIRYIPREAARKFDNPNHYARAYRRFCFAGSERRLESATLQETQTRGGESQHDLKGDRDCSHQEAFESKKNLRADPPMKFAHPELQLKLLRKVSFEGPLDRE
jgi:hypothetical protein